MAREIRLVGDISAVELRDGLLTVTMDGSDLQFPVGGDTRSVAPRQAARATKSQVVAPSTTPETPATEAPAAAEALAAVAHNSRRNGAAPPESAAK